MVIIKKGVFSLILGIKLIIISLLIRIQIIKLMLIKFYYIEVYKLKHFLRSIILCPQKHLLLLINQIFKDLSLIMRYFV